MHDETREMEYLVQLRNPWTGAYSRTFDLKGYADGVWTSPGGGNTRVAPRLWARTLSTGKRCTRMATWS
jgi:hypothetical protein